MTRQSLVVANWKMHHGIEETIKFATEFTRTKLSDRVEVVLCPPFTSLYTLSIALGEDSAVKLGAQNCHFETKGAFTGEISVDFLREMSCEYVIIGHSERRQHFKEDNELLAKKVMKVFEAGLTPIYCVGETEHQREAHETFKVLTDQLSGGLKSLSRDQAGQLVVAYEPVWAIGTGQTATPEMAQEAHAFIRKWLGQNFGTSFGLTTRILYGGSVKPDNAGDLMKQQDIDGSLVGGASLQSSDFGRIVSASR